MNDLPIVAWVIAGVNAVAVALMWHRLRHLPAPGIPTWRLFDIAIALLFVAPGYLPVLLFWARIGPRLGWFESSFRGLAVGSILLALPAALAAVISYGIMDDPFGYKGMALLEFGGWIWLATALSLFMPRRLIPGLRAGTFS